MRKAKLRFLIVCIVVGLFGAVCVQAAPPANDNCANAEPVGDVTNLLFDTTEATHDGTGTCTGGPNIWYCYTATCSGSVTVSLCGSSYDTKLAVYEGCSCDPLGALLACSDDYCDLQSQVTFVATEGNTYLIEVGGYSSSDTGPGVMSISCAPPPPPPANDNCADAEPVGDVTNQPFDTTNATFDGSGSCMDSPNIWYCYTATCSGSVTVSLCGSSYDTMLAVYEGCSCNPLGTNIVCNDDSSCGLQSQVTFAATEGYTYLIEVGGYSSYTGLGVMSISCVAETPCACCFSDGSCADLNPSVCTYQGGTPEGEGTSCATYPCPQTIEACCLPDGSCADLPPSVCVGQGGTSQGPGTDCETVNCGGTPPFITKYVQQPDLSDLGMDVDATYNASGGEWPPQLLADDFNCTTAGPITDIHIWGSWYHDILPYGDPRNVEFVLSIHSNIPADPCNPNSYSMPGELLWSRYFGPGEFEVYEEAGGLHEGYYVPCVPYYEPNSDWTCWRYDFYILPLEAFEQEGDPCNPVIYWLDVQAFNYSTGEPARFGWKTSLDHWMDDAVFAVGIEGDHGPWQELRYPQGHPYCPNSIDLAFEITTQKPPKPPVPHLKWSQPPVEIDPTALTPTYCGWDEPSHLIEPGYWKVVADDFRCLGKMPVSSIHWWGSYVEWSGDEPPMPSPVAWKIGFWSNVPAGVGAEYSYPGELLWQIDVPVDRVDVNNVGQDYFPGIIYSDTCFQYYVQLNPDEYFWQDRFEPNTVDNVFWLSIAAVYDGPFEYTWGWKTRPMHWMDDAVTFYLDGDPYLGMPPLDPGLNYITPLERDIGGVMESYDVAFELDTEPNWIKWEQPYTGLRNWDSYTDIFSSAIEYEEGLDIYGMAADDWLCQRRTPVSSIVWWGSYMGYMYMPCEPIAEPLIPPDYFLISVWTDVPASDGSNCCSAHSWPGCDDPACEASVCSYDSYCCNTEWDSYCADEARSDPNCNCGGGLPYSHPGRKVWEYKAYNYDEVMVGYDKRAPAATGNDGDGGSLEPVFRYSVRLPEEDWFCQPDVNAIYWLSVMAVWNEGEMEYSWGWTNHKYVFGDDGVQGWPDYYDPNIWYWEEIIDWETGESRDLSFMLFTEPDYCCKCANFNVDTIINFLDYADFADDWLWTGPAGGYNNSDLNCDGSVDWYDVKIFVDQWLDSCP